MTAGPFFSDGHHLFHYSDDGSFITAAAIPPFLVTAGVCDGVGVPYTFPADFAAFGSSDGVLWNALGTAEAAGWSMSPRLFGTIHDVTVDAADSFWFGGDNFGRDANNLVHIAHDGTVLGQWIAGGNWRVGIWRVALTASGTVWWSTTDTDDPLHHFDPASGTALTPLALNDGNVTTGLAAMDVKVRSNGDIVVLLAHSGPSGAVMHCDASGAILHVYKWQDFAAYYAADVIDWSFSPTFEQMALSDDGKTLWIVGSSAAGGTRFYRIDLVAGLFLPAINIDITSGTPTDGYNADIWWQSAQRTLTAKTGSTRLYRQA